MSARGGRGGGRGGRGGAAGKNQAPMGRLHYGDIQESQQRDRSMAGVLYPPLAEEDYPQTDFPSDREARIANRYNTMTSEMKFTPFWIDAPTKANQDIERWTDRYKKGPTKFGGGGDSDEKEPQTLESIKVDRRLDKGLLPAAVFEAVYEKKKRVRAGGDDARSARRKQVKLDTVLGEADAPEGGEGDDNTGSEAEEDPEFLEEEDEEDENDYDDNYFDNGEDDGGDGDALGGGGDEDGGTFD